jgi:hypothetical protein
MPDVKSGSNDASIELKSTPLETGTCGNQGGFSSRFFMSLRTIAGLVLGLLLVLAMALPPANAIKDATNQGRWTKPVGGGPDKEVPGFLINLGPTGARAVLNEKSLLVKYIFGSSPAEATLKLGDVITGVFNKPFSAHTFGGDPHGYEGPLLEFGEAIERAESKDGKLVLSVSRARRLKIRRRCRRRRGGCMWRSRKW